MERSVVPNTTERLFACFSLVVAMGAGGIASSTEVALQPEAQNLAVIPKRSPVSGAQELEIDEPDFLSQVQPNRANRRARQFGHVPRTFLYR